MTLRRRHQHIEALTSTLNIINQSKGHAVPTKEILSIQYLRALAALSVLSFHIIVRFGGSLPIGASGVDVFFVISGFIMWDTTVDRCITPTGFLLRRAIRIVPNYWIATAATALLILVRPNFMFGHELDPYRFTGSLLFLPTLTGSKLVPVVLQGWTLVYEMVFYVTFAISLLLNQRYRPFFLTASLCSLVLLHAFAKEPHIVSVTDPILLDFLAGVWLGILWKNSCITTGIAALFFVIGATGLVLSECMQPDLPQIVKFGMPAISLVAGCVFLEKNQGTREVRVLQFLGAASYSIYLWHIASASVLDGLLLRVRLPLNVHALLVAVGTVFLTCIIYLFVEAPITRHLRIFVANWSLKHAKDVIR